LACAPSQLEFGCLSEEVASDDEDYLVDEVAATDEKRGEGFETRLNVELDT